MRRLFRATPLVAAVLVLGGCGFNNITENEASEGWQVAGKPLAESQQKLTAKLESDTGMGGFPSGETSVTVDCDEGGDVELVADITLDTSGPTPQPSVDMAIDYRDCEDQQVTVNGGLDIKFPDGFSFGGSDSDDSQPTKVRYVGELDFTGDVDGPCKIDMTAETSGQGSRPTYEGDLCGYDAAEMLNMSF